MNILFVEARYFGSRASPVNENLSLYILATFLKDNMPEVDFNFDFAYSHNYMEYAQKNTYDLCGIYATTQAWNQANKVASKMKAKGVLGIVGGPHISSALYSLSHHFVAGCIGPGESINDMDKTVRFIRDHKIHNVQAYLIKPLPGTLFWDELVSLGKIIKEEVDFQELDLTNSSPKWYFNDSVPFDRTVGYMKKIKWLGYYRTIRHNFMDKLLYQAAYRQLKLLVTKG